MHGLIPIYSPSSIPRHFRKAKDTAVRNPTKKLPDTILRIPTRRLTNPARWVIEVAGDGVNVFRQLPNGAFDIVYATVKAVDTARKKINLKGKI
jgi:hypothetical protein